MLLVRDGAIRLDGALLPQEVVGGGCPELSRERWVMLRLRREELPFSGDGCAIL